MRLDIQSREYRLPSPLNERVRLSFFLNAGQFTSHIRDHFAHPREAWAEVLGPPVSEKCRQIVDGGDVSSLEEVYDRVVRVLDEGIDSAINRPVFIAFDQRLEERDEQRSGYFFLSDKGFYVVAHGDSVRTALFVGGDAARESPITRFRKAWENLRQKCLKKPYRDSKGGDTVWTEGVTRVSEENWEKCPVAEPGPIKVLLVDMAEATRRLLKRIDVTLGKPGEGTS